MYLSNLQLRNFRNYKSSNFVYKSGVNTIIGENDTGKSNALTAMRILLDDSFFYNEKRLKETDFNFELDWRGHWIIISANFEGISKEDAASELWAEIKVKLGESKNELKKIITGTCETGTVTLFIRPNYTVRKKLFQCNETDKFNAFRESITLNDYEFYYTAQSCADFTCNETYKNVVGDFDNKIASNPDDDDKYYLGNRIYISDIHKHINVVFIDALRDVVQELHSQKSPIRKIIEKIKSEIPDIAIDAIKKKIADLNEYIENVDKINKIGTNIKSKMDDTVGLTYAPNIKVSSNLTDNINKLSRYLTMQTDHNDDIDLLGLGHMNIIYIALKMVEFEINRSLELVNIMLIEEPEAHIHAHIQKTMFGNLGASEEYTQIIMTTHSVHISEASEISRMNIIKSQKKTSQVMHPNNKLKEFVDSKLEKSNIAFYKKIERYLDAKRSTLMFSKGVILVEGDGEEIIIPAMVEKAMGIKLDEIGISIINIGSVAFENIAALFAEDRVQKYCAIVTDLDKQVVTKSSSHYSSNAEERGEQRKKKLNRCFSDNVFVESFLCDNTLEIEFIKYDDNIEYVKEVVLKSYVQEETVDDFVNILDNGTLAEKANKVLTLAKREGKGWYSLLLADELDVNVTIPEYILDAIVFASKETVSDHILYKSIYYSIECYDNVSNELKAIYKDKEKYSEISELFIQEFPKDMVSLFIMKYQPERDH